MRRIGPDSILLAIALAALVGWPILATGLEATQILPPRQCPWDPAPMAVEMERSPSMGGPEIAAPTGPAIQTLLLVGGATAIAVPIGVVAGFFLFRTDLWGRRGLLALVLIVLFVPLPLHATAWLGSFGNAGRSQAIGSAPILVGLRGAIFVHAMAALPWVVLVSGIGLRSVERELEESALMDLPAWRVALSVTLRRSIGAVAASALAVAVLTAGDMTVTDLLQVRTYAEEAYLQAQANGVTAAASVALPPTIVLGLLIAWAARGLSRFDPNRLASSENSARRWRLGRWRVPVGILAWLTIGNVLALPIYGLLWRAGRVGGFAGHPPEWSPGGLYGTLGDALGEISGPLGKSALWAAIGASATIAIAWPMAWAARREGMWRWIVIAIISLLFACPGPVAGLAMVLAYNAPRPCLDDPLSIWATFLGRVGIYDSMAIVVLAYVARTLPYAVLVLWPAARAVPDAFLESASVDGLGPRELARRVAWPMMKGATLAAWGLAFVLAIGELPATNIVEPPAHTMLVSKLVWSLIHTGVESHLAGVGLVLIAAIGAAGSVVGWLLGRAFGFERDPG